MSMTWTWASAEIFPGGTQRQHFAYPFQVADDAERMDVHKTLHVFYTAKKMPCVNFNFQGRANGCFTLPMRMDLEQFFCDFKSSIS